MRCPVLEGSTTRNIPITKSTSEARSIFDLLGDREHGRDFDLQTEKTLVKGSSVLSVELFGGLKPDIVIWSKRSSQNRIVIEVKQATEATHRRRFAILTLLFPPSRYIRQDTEGKSRH